MRHFHRSMSGLRRARLGFRRADCPPAPAREPGLVLDSGDPEYRYWLMPGFGRYHAVGVRALTASCATHRTTHLYL